MASEKVLSELLKHLVARNIQKNKQHRNLNDLNVFSNLIDWKSIMFRYGSYTLNKMIKLNDRRNERLKQEKVRQVVKTRIASFIKNPQDQEDVAQEVFMKMCKNQAKYSEEGKLSAWSSRVSRNVAVSYLRQQSRLKTCSVEDMTCEVEGGVNSEIDTHRLRSEALSILTKKLTDAERNDINFKISKDLIVFKMSKRSIRVKEHVGIKRLNRVVDESRTYLLQLMADIRKEYEEEGFTVVD